MEKTLGGNRLGAGSNMKVQMHGFERSTHDLGYVWRNTQAPGTLVPFMNILALPGDTFDINLGADVKTHPTVGPLFASFKLQLDVFECPIRLYHSWLHNNKLNVGNKMATVKLPVMELDGNPLFYDPEYDPTKDPIKTPLEFQQVNQSALLAYLGIRGIGNGDINTTIATKQAIPYLAYWDIYKNYYANKQEEIGACIHTENNNIHITECILYANGVEVYRGNGCNILYKPEPNAVITYSIRAAKTWGENPLVFNVVRDIDSQRIGDTSSNLPAPTTTYPTEYFWDALVFPYDEISDDLIVGIAIEELKYIEDVEKQIAIKTFPLENIDTMREYILAHYGNSPFLLHKDSIEPYNLPLKKLNSADSTGQMCSVITQEGLALKTYQSDIFQNWMNSEWLDGEGGINEITAVDTSSGSFDINTLNLAQKVYDMLNRIAISGGSYDDWQEAVYDHNGYRKAETPMYMGGLSKEIAFQEVVATTAAPATGEQTNDQPLGKLGGKGFMTKKHKGGTVNIKVTEPSFIIGIVSITPRIDYSQGNDWTTLLKTMDDLHKPSLDQIGFQDLVTDQIAFWDTIVENDVLTFHSAGKQPAWLNYMTNYNKLYGNFADSRSEMFMTLARKYEVDNTTKRIKDLTTYIDPTKYNYAFAQTDLSAQNFWVQIGCDITARRKISAKLMPNL